jgi:hypothetical protein
MRPSSGARTGQRASHRKWRIHYLLRLERARYFQSVCVLLRGNGQYHLERHNPQKIRIFEGSLQDGELRNIVHIVSGDRLFNLEENKFRI